jgi:ABC-type bacteriocin/lantibiotic exporter with double-glycine peptidase domain
MKPDYGYFEEKKLGKTYDVRLLKRLSPFTRPYRMLLFGSIALVLLITVLDLALPYVIKIAIDRYIVPQMNQNLAVDNESEDATRNP